MMPNENKHQEIIEKLFNNLPEQDSIVYDGAIDIHKWECSPIRILFYYKETYGYNDWGGTSISAHFEKWIKDNIPTYKKMGLLAFLLFETVKNHTILDYDETNLKKFYANHDLLIEALSETSIVNIGKISISQNNTSDCIIRHKSRKNSELLKNQLELLAPNIIICGGRVTADSLYVDLNYLSQTKYNFNTAEIIDNKIIAPYNHLSSSSCWYKKIYNYYIQVSNLIPELKI